MATKDEQRILVIEDNLLDFALIEREFRRFERPLQSLRVETLDGLSAALEDGCWDAVIVDHVVPGMRFEDNLALIKRCLPGVPVIMVSGGIGEERAIELLKQGLWDFVLKDHLIRLNSVLKRNLQEAKEHRRLQRAEQALQASRERDYDLIENSQDLICTHDLTGKLLSVNAAVEHCTGYTREQLLGMNLADLLTWGTLAGLPGYLDEIRSKGTARGQTRVRTASGETRWWEFDNCLHTAGVVVPVVRGMAHDITEHKQRQHRLNTLSKAVEQSPVSIVIVDFQGNIEYVNSKFEQITGYASAEVIGKNPRFLRSGAKSTEEYRQLWATITSGNIWRGEFHNRRKDGTLFWESASISPVLSEQGAVVNFVAVKEDITERKAAELRERIEQEQIFRNARLIEIGAMASALAHELNQPLTAIANYGAVAERLLAAETLDRPRLQQILDYIQQDTLRSGKILWSVRKFTKKRESLRKINDINELVKSMVYLEWISVFTSEVEVHLALDAAVPTLWFDQVQIEQVLVNLIKNGIESMPGLEQERRLEIATRLFRAANELQVSVRDFGCGLPERIALDLFTPFFTTKTNGMGLGLTICKSIIEAHGGRIWATANADRGTTFTFALPLSRSS